MQPTFGQIFTLALGFLGDERGQVFKAPLLRLFANAALNELNSVLRTNQLPEALVIAAPVVLTAGVMSLDPVVANLYGFSEPKRVEERPNGTSQLYTDVDRVDTLPQGLPGPSLGVYTNNSGQFQFIGATQDIQLRFSYFASGNAEALSDTATLAIDDSLNFVAAATAALAGNAKGYTSEAAAARVAAYGESPNPLEIHGGYLGQLISPMIRVQQQAPIQAPRYRAGGGYRSFGS